MPTINPRISVTLQPQLAAILKRLSELTGNSQSALIGDLLGSSIGVFERMVSILQAASDLKAEGMQVTDEIKDGLRLAHEKLEVQLGLVFENLDAGGKPILDAAEKLGRRAARQGARSAHGTAASVPAAPLSNRGVTPRGKAIKARANTGVAPRRVA